MKTCTKCKKEKTFAEFHKSKGEKDGFFNYCKVCKSAYQKKWEQKNKEKRAAYHKEWENQNKEKRVASKKEWDKQNKERVAAYSKEYRQQNKKQKAAYYRNRFRTDPLYRLTHNLRSRVRDALNGKTKSASTIKLLGCEPEFAIAHIESQFLSGMSWDNYGEWHVDHITPCAAFNMEIEEHQYQCFHYTNLQPLWAKQNLLKNDRITEWNHTYEACLERIKTLTL